MPQRATRTSFQKGHAGNRKGRPKPSAETEELRALARGHGPEAIAALLEIATGRDPYAMKYPAARVAAATALLDRGYGRPRQAVDVQAAVGSPASWAELAAGVAEVLDAPSRRLLDEGDE